MPTTDNYECHEYDVRFIKVLDFLNINDVGIVGVDHVQIITI